METLLLLDSTKTSINLDKTTFYMNISWTKLLMGNLYEMWELRLSKKYPLLNKNLIPSLTNTNLALSFIIPLMEYMIFLEKGSLILFP